MGAYEMFVDRYFRGAESLYNEDAFQRGFGSPRLAIDRVIEELIGNGPFLPKRNIAGGKLGIWLLVCTVTSLWMLVYGDAQDCLDESLWICESA